MNELKCGRFDESTLATLEFPDVIAQIVALATCDPGAAAVRALRPQHDRAASAADLALVVDATAVFQAGRDFGFSGAAPLGDACDRAELGSTLGGVELAAIAHAERALAGGVAAIAGERADRKTTQATSLERLSEQRRDTGALTRRLSASVAEDGVLLDSASSELARVRRQQRAAADEVRRKLDEIIRNPNTAKLLSESIVTVRRGRFVVPVRVEEAAHFNGVVHDQSASGATVFIEPMACVEANNRLRGLEAAEEREIQRILAELTALVGASGDDLRANARLLARL